MQPAVIVEAHPVDHLVHRRSAGREAHAVQAAYLQRSPQALRRRVIPAVALAAHRGMHAVGGKRSLELVAAVLTSPIRVEDQPGLRLAPEPRHSQRVDHELLFHSRLHRPTDDLAAEEIDHRRQVQLAFPGIDVGDVARPDAVRRTLRELPALRGSAPPADCASSRSSLCTSSWLSP